MMKYSMKAGEEMNRVRERFVQSGAVMPFHTQLSYVEITRDSPRNQCNSHVHPECEIYINLSGNVSFMVENRIYPVLPGSIVITRPFEYHHCIYHDNSLHKHFWILFSANGNEHLFPRFFERKAGENNLLTLPSDQQKELIALCLEIAEKPAGEVEEYYRFFKLMRLLECADISTPALNVYPQDVAYALEYIDRHYAESISVSMLAQAAHVSINTLERHFEETLHMPPTLYLKKKRLGVAAELLYGGATVSDACNGSGFSDYSNFIALFRKTYGLTPLKYKNSAKR